MRVSVFMAIEFPFTLPNPNTPPAVMRWMDGWREGWMDEGVDSDEGCLAGVVVGLRILEGRYGGIVSIINLLDRYRCRVSCSCWW